jgi:hypothetical protein
MLRLELGERLERVEFLIGEVRGIRPRWVAFGDRSTELRLHAPTLASAAGSIGDPNGVSRRLSGQARWVEFR